MKIAALNFLILFAGISLFPSCTKEEKEEKLPNIVYILADDLGIGDVSIYNDHSRWNTPALDQLASEGMFFTDAHSGSAVCTPTRYGILTGRYSWRGVIKKGVTWSYDSAIIEPGRETVSAMLQKKGYRTACIGKWHLGLNWVKDSTAGWPVDFSQPVQKSPNDFGFDYSFCIPASLDIPPYVYVENGRVTAQPNRETESTTQYGWWRKGPTGEDFFHEKVLETFGEKAVQFIGENKDQPFFLYLPLSAPHTPILPVDSFGGKSGLNEYGDFVVMVDEITRRVTQALEENGLTNNTLVIFTSDNGCAPYAGTAEMEKAGHYSSFIYRGYKADIYEGGHRIPFIARWPGHIPAGTSSNQTTCLTDLMATCADILHIPLAENQAEDSYSMLPALKGNSGETPIREATVHHSVHGNFAIRKGNWKLILAPGSGGWSEPKPGEEPEDALPFQLYNLETDPRESENLLNQEPQKAEELRQLLISYIQNGRSTPGPAQPYEQAENWPGLEWMK
ncbi:MAG: arylsulfatase [Bacteroidia bacterium]